MPQELDFTAVGIRYGGILYIEARAGGLSLELNYDLNNGMTLTSVTGYRSFDTSSIIDSDFSDVAVLERIQTAQQSSISQELRIAKSYDNGANFVAGAYFFSQDLDNQKETGRGKGNS